jgi:hypothetical protein
MKYTISAFFYFCFSVISFTQTTPKVVSVYPPNQLVNADHNTKIIVTFDSAIDPASITDTSLYIFGRWSGIAKGSISLSDENKTLTFTLEKPFYTGEFVIVNLSKKIKDISGTPVESGYAWNFWIKTGQGSMDLVKTSQINVRREGEGWIQTYGAYAGDLDMDGYTDFLVPNEVANDVRVFMNDKEGGYSDFKVFSMPGGSRPSTNEGADFNLDGFMDIAVGNSTNDKVTVFLGDGKGGFLSVENYNAAQEVRGLMVIDVNGDGFMDIVTANRVASNIAILINNGDGTFADPILIEAGGNGETTLSAANVNGDGLIDIFVGALSSREIILLLGDGKGNFTFKDKVTVTGQPWFTCAGDINGDGIADIVSANSSGNRFAVILCDSMGNLSEPVYYTTGSFPLSIDLGDVDGDGDLDVVTSNYSSGTYTLYENDGTGIFINRKDLFASTSGSCSVFHDRDNDGDLDMTGVDEIDDLLILFENPGPSTNADDNQNFLYDFNLAQNYPNPFNPVTTIHYSVPHRSNVTLKVYDILGNEVAALVNEEKERGVYTVNFDASHLASGMYLYRLQAGSFVETKKMILIK